MDPRRNEVIQNERVDLVEQNKEIGRNLKVLRVEIAEAKDKEEPDEKIVEIIEGNKIMDGKSLIEMRDGIEDERFEIEELKRVKEYGEILKKNPRLTYVIKGHLKKVAVEMGMGELFEELKNKNPNDVNNEIRSDTRAELRHITEVENLAKVAGDELLNQAVLVHDVVKWMKPDEKLLFALGEHEVLSAWQAAKVCEDIVSSLQNDFELRGYFDNDGDFENFVKLDGEMVGRVMRKIVLSHGDHEFPRNKTVWLDKLKKRVGILFGGVHAGAVTPDEMEWVENEENLGSEGKELVEYFKNLGREMNAADILTGLSLSSLLKYRFGYGPVNLKDGLVSYIDNNILDSEAENFVYAPGVGGIKEQPKIDLERRRVALFYQMVMDADGLGEKGREKYKGKLVVDLEARKMEKIGKVAEKFNVSNEDVVESDGQVIDVGERMYERALEMVDNAHHVEEIYKRGYERVSKAAGDIKDVEEYLNEEEKREVEIAKKGVDGLMGILFTGMPLLFEEDLRVDEDNLRVGDDLRKEIDNNLEKRFGGLTEAPVSVEEWEKRKER